MNLFPIAKKLQEFFNPKISDYECKDGMNLNLGRRPCF